MTKASSNWATSVSKPNLCRSTSAVRADEPTRVARDRADIPLESLSFDDEPGKAALLEQILKGAPIDVGGNVWIGAGAMILPGVTIGRDAVVAAGSIVAYGVPAASLIAGPKRTVRRRW
ncbi:MAG: DapH/DapD/GlmU-related protein [Lacisediminihabitans sp.]